MDRWRSRASALPDISAQVPGLQSGNHSPVTCPLRLFSCHNGNYGDLDARASGNRADLHGRSTGRIATEIFRVHLIHLLKLAEIGHVDHSRPLESQLVVEIQ